MAASATSHDKNGDNSTVEKYLFSVHGPRHQGIDWILPSSSMYQ